MQTTAPLWPSTLLSQAQDLWLRLYHADPPWAAPDLTPLSLAATIAADLARMATVELQVRVTGSPRADFLAAQLAPLLPRLRDILEQTIAGGAVLLRPYPDGGNLLIDAIPADRFRPLDATPHTLHSCVLLDRATLDGHDYARLETHTLTPQGVQLQNAAYRLAPGLTLSGRPVPLETIPRWAALAESQTLPGLTAPLFALLRLPGPNHVQPDSPLGVALYARAIPLLREADKQFSRLLWEMDSGSRALYVDMRAFLPDDAQPGDLPFKRFYRTLDADPQGETLFAEWSPALREEHQIRALHEILQHIEDACGLSHGALARADAALSQPRTATELKMRRQRTYTTVRDIQRALETALRDLLRVLDTWATLLGLCPPGPWEAAFEFDDSIVSDRATEFDERLRLLSAGVLTPQELRDWYLGAPQP